MKQTFLILLLLAGLCSSLTAGQEKPGYPYFLITPPVPGYTEQTGWSGMILGMMLYMNGENNSGTYPSLLYSKITYTQNNQLDLLAEVDNYTANNDWYFKAAAGYRKFPDKFYGTGSDISDDAEDYTIESITCWIEAYRKIAGNFYGGARIRLQNDNMVSLDQAGRLAEGSIAGSKGGMSSGFGILLKFESRDSTFFAMEGDYHIISADFFGHTMGGDNEFQVYTADLRRYLRIGENQSVGIRVYSETVAGNPPFNYYALLGGSLKLRGYAFSKYRDNVIGFGSAEYKIILLDWLAVSAFAGIGGNADSWDSPADIKYSAGIGSRIIVDKGNKTNLRVDLAFGKDGFAFYLDLGDNI